MIVKVYENAETYLLDNEAILLEEEAASQLVLYDATKVGRIQRRIKDYSVWLWMRNR